jgi:hypothetical protein
MSKTIQIDLSLDSYKDFFDREWFANRTEQTRGTALYQPVFDLGAAWRCTANTHVLPWLLVRMVHNAIEMNLNTTEPFGKRYITDVRNLLVQRMGDSLRNMQKKRLQSELDAIYDKACAITAEVSLGAPDATWQKMLENSEFRFALVGSQRLCYGALYYAYEDFVARCVGLARGRIGGRMFRRKHFQTAITAEFGTAVCAKCWDDGDVSLARLSRHALAHNGCRVTEEFKAASIAASNSLVVEGGEIQIMAADTTALFHLLRDRADDLMAAALQHPGIGSSRKD